MRGCPDSAAGDGKHQRQIAGAVRINNIAAAQARPAWDNYAIQADGGRLGDASCAIKLDDSSFRDRNYRAECND